MAIDDREKLDNPLPEPWQTLNDLAYWLDSVRQYTVKDDPTTANAAMGDALRAATRDLLTIVKFYRTDWERPADVNRDLVPRFTVRALHKDGTTNTHGIFATEQEAVEAATHLATEMSGIVHTWVQRSLVPVLVEQAHEALARFLDEIGLTEDELADAIIHHPA